MGFICSLDESKDLVATKNLVEIKDDIEALVRHK